MRKNLPWILLLIALFAIPAVLVRITMQDVPQRSEIKVVTVFQKAADVIEGNFKRHRSFQAGNLAIRINPLPTNSFQWIQLINPTGRKAPGGGYAILEQADTTTGAIGLSGDSKSVTLTVPAYRTLEEQHVTITLLLEIADQETNGTVEPSSLKASGQ